MKGDKVRDLDTKELQNQVREAADQLFHLRFQMRMGQLDGLKKYRALRKDRARMLTVLQEKQQAEAGSQGAPAAEKG
jgi:large subunit ribosomal protein L29